VFVKIQTQLPASIPIATTLLYETGKKRLFKLLIKKSSNKRLCFIFFPVFGKELSQIISKKFKIQSLFIF